MGLSSRKRPTSRVAVKVPGQRTPGANDGAIGWRCLDFGGGAGPSNSRMFGRSYRILLTDVASDRLAPDAAVPSAQRKKESGAQGTWAGLSGYVAEWAVLPEDWDGDGGRPPSPSVVSGACGMIDRMKAAGVPIPRIYVVGDGEIGFRWEAGRMYASASFVDDGDVLLYMHEGDTVLHSLDVRWSEDLDLEPFLRDVARLA